MDDQEAKALFFLQPDETAAQFLSRCHVEPLRTGLVFIDARSPLRPSNFVEVAGLAGTGKSELLYSIAATCILPSLHGGVQYGGYCSNVLFFDLDCKFDIVRLAQILQDRVHAARMAAGQVLMFYKMLIIAPSQGNEVADVVKDSATRLHLVSCPSSFAFLAALKVAKPTVTSLLENGGIGAILIDNVAAHYYTDRVSKGQGDEGAPLTLMRVHAAMAAGLKQLQLAYRVPIIATRHVLSAGGGDRDGWAVRESMMKPWLDTVTHRLVLRRGGPGGQPALAKWVKPPLPHEDRYIVSGGGMHML